MNCQGATFVDGQGSAVGRFDFHFLESQRRVAGDGGNDEFVGGGSYALAHFDRAGETGRRSTFSFFVAPFAIGAREGDGICVAGRQRQRLKGSQIGGRGQVVGLGGKERALPVLCRQAIVAKANDLFQLRELATRIGADGAEGFCIFGASPVSDLVGDLIEEGIGAVYRIGGDVGGRGGGVISYRQLDLGAGVVVGKGSIIILSDNTTGLFIRGVPGSFHAFDI